MLNYNTTVIRIKKIMEIKNELVDYDVLSMVINSCLKVVKTLEFRLMCYAT